MTPQGGVTEEAARVLAAVEGWLRGASAPPVSGQSGAHESGVVRDLFAPAAGHRTDSPCAVCPLCQLISAARAVRPEVVEHLAEAMASVLLAFRALTEPVVAEPQESSPTGHDEDQPVVQHITIT